MFYEWLMDGIGIMFQIKKYILALFSTLMLKYEFQKNISHQDIMVDKSAKKIVFDGEPGQIFKRKLHYYMGLNIFWSSTDMHVLRLVDGWHWNYVSN